MRRFFTLLLVLTLCIPSVFAQSKAKEMLAEIEGKYTLDDNGGVSFVSYIEVPGMSKDDIFMRAQNYFVYKYGYGKAVIQTQDKDLGVLVGKGVYDNVHVGSSMIMTEVDAWHILRVDAKEGKARVIITLTGYEKDITSMNGEKSHGDFVSIASQYPFNPKGGQKTIMSKAFYKSYQAAMESLDGVEKAIKEGNTAKAIENADW